MSEMSELPNPNRRIALDPAKREFLEQKREEYRRRAELSGDAVQKLVNDAYYKLVILGILFKSEPNEVTIGEAYDELVATDGKANVDLALLERGFLVIEAYNRGELHRVLSKDEKRRRKHCT